MVAGETLRVVARYSGPNSSEILNVFHYQYAGAGDTDAAVLAECETFFTDEWGDEWADFASHDVTLDEIELDVITDAGLVARNIGSAAIGVTGSLASDMSPTGVACLLTADTIFPKQRGRKFVPGLNELGVSDSLLVAVTVANLVLLTVKYLASITGLLNGELFPGVLSKTLENFVAFGSTGAVTDVPAYQRRRKPNVGS